MQKMNLLVTLDENYIPYLNVMLSSLLYSNPDNYFYVYLLHSSVPEKATVETTRILGNSGRLIPIQVKDIGLEGAPTTSRYPQEIYYRIFAAKYLPQDLDRVLYLDPDLIVNGSSFTISPSMIITSLQRPMSETCCTKSTSCGWAWMRIVPILTPVSC